jgi:hypothetical protein
MGPVRSLPGTRNFGPIANTSSIESNILITRSTNEYLLSDHKDAATRVAVAGVMLSMSITAGYP